MFFKNAPNHLICTATAIFTAALLAACHGDSHKQANSDETVVVEALPLPPTAPSDEVGSCTAEINPNFTGCLNASRAGIDGTRTFSPDGKQVYVSVRFAGAPEAPAPGSDYSGAQLIMVKTDGTTFENGDGWQCVTCGIPPENRVAINNPNDNTYPEAFQDGMRIKMGNNILDCSPYEITAPECTPEQTHIYPIISPFPGFPSGGLMREVRLHPDNVHLGWNQLFFALDFSAASEFGVFGRLEFNPAPASGRVGYELKDVSFLLSPQLGKSGRFFSVTSPGELLFENPTGVIGEFRGFTPDGKSTLGIGTQDSFNYDIFATDLATGVSTRLSYDPAYVDPVNISPDGKSMVIMDGRITDNTGFEGANPAGEEGRVYFASAGIGVPPLLDLAIAEAIGGLYTNSNRGSFFQPYLINLETPIDVEEANIHQGQQLNAGGDTTAGSGSISDPLWLGGADPAWSPDSTAVVYYQRRGCNPEPPTCPESTEPGGRNSRLMIARLTDREPSTPIVVTEAVADDIPWGIPYQAGDAVPPSREVVPAGDYVLMGVEGYADVTITTSPSRFKIGDVEIDSVAVSYNNYSADGVNFIDGTESGTRASESGVTTLTWQADLTFSGLHSGSRTSDPTEGFVVTSNGLGTTATFSGQLTTVLDGVTYTSP
ncbi:hypothetical protein [Halioxenophilus sp. WMMB6]|uniref:hypothetical protein n=1 Tax=Halioxenophilus sp. WMMB6 TaxID=3073815 RepID=UPI00295E2FAD|nr:hypothetical protein [Halioxenophilus sp. WMMB6]